MFFRGNKGSDAPAADPEWVRQGADLIERVVDSAREKAVVPLTTIARALVYGLLAAFVGVSALVLLTIALVRLADVYLDNIPGAPSGVWLAYLVLGTLFVAAGTYVWSKRSPSQESH